MQGTHFKADDANYNNQQMLQYLRKHNKSAIDGSEQDDLSKITSSEGFHENNKYTTSDKSFVSLQY